MSKYPKLVQCQITGILAWVNSAEEEDRFHRSSMWAMAICTIGAILGTGVFFLLRWFGMV